MTTLDAAALPGPMALVCDGEDEGLFLLDGTSGGSARMLAHGRCDFPCWSPDGRHLAFRCDGDLRLASAGRQDAETLIGGLPVDARRPLAFRPDGQWLAAVVEGGVMVLPIDRPDANAGFLSISSHVQADVLLWTGMGDCLAILCHPRPNAASAGLAPSQLVRWQPARGEILQSTARFDLMAGRGPDDLIVTQAIDGWSARRADLFKRDGQIVPLYEAPYGQFIYDYLSHSDTFVLGSFGEDPGAPVDFELMPASGGGPTPCLQELWGVLDVSFSENGESASILCDPSCELSDGSCLGILDVASSALSWFSEAALGGVDGSTLRQAVLGPIAGRWKP